MSVKDKSVKEITDSAKSTATGEYKKPSVWSVIVFAVNVVGFIFALFYEILPKLAGLLKKLLASFRKVIKK